MKSRPARFPGLCAGLVLLGSTASAQPKITNGGFEADRYIAYPGLSAGNGKRITGWTYTGNAGINPTHGKDDKPASPFADNARTPEKAHVLFIQNEGTVSQQVAGFAKGRTYRVHFRENARAFNRTATLPKLTVRLGGKTVVSPHLIEPVCKEGRRDMPYARVVSDVFVPVADGDYELVFQALNGGGVSVLIDDVRIVESKATGKD